MWLNKKLGALLLSFFITAALYAQQSNIQQYTPSILFGKGEWEVNVYNNIYTQTKVRDRDGDKVRLGQRQTFLNSTFRFTYGVSNSGRVNLGLDVNVNRSLYDNDEDGPLKVLGGDGDLDRFVVSSIGPRIKFVPFSSLSNFSVQSTFLLPVADDLESPFFTAHDRYTWWTQVFYDHELAADWRVFLEADVLYRLKREEEQVNFVRFPLSAFLSYFPSSYITLFVYGQYAPRFQNVSNAVDEKFGLSNWYTQLGAGLKYQLTSKIGLEFSYGNFVSSRSDGAGYALNLGVRYIH